MDPATAPITPTETALPDPAAEAELANKFGELVVTMILLDEIFDHIAENE